MDAVGGRRIHCDQRWFRMFIPNADRVTVPKEKICGYLLSTSHPAGQSKAVFFLKFGFKVENWRELAISSLLKFSGISANEIVEDRSK